MATNLLQRQFTAVAGSGKYSLVSYPGQGVTSTSPDAPELILIFGWMNARLPHIHKYTELYHRTYPSATQLLVRSFGDYLYASSRTVPRDLLPVAKILSEYQQKRVLVHTFSNGGCLMLISLADALSTLSQSPTPIPASAVVLDSCPGDSNPMSSARAFSAVTNPLFQWPLRAFMLAIFCTYWLYRRITFKGDYFDAMRRKLLDPQVLSHGGPRTYIYSYADKLINPKAVEVHAADAKRLGLHANLEKFENTPHVNHLGKGNQERYFDVVRRTWDRSRET